MENLRKLVKISQKTHAQAENKRKAIFDNPLIKLLLQNEEINEKQVMNILGVKSKSTLKTSIYRLETDTILQIYDSLQYTQDLDIRLYAKATIAKLIAISLGLIKEGNREVGILVIQRALFYAKKHNFSELIVICLQKLCFHYSMNQIDIKKYTILAKELEKYNQIHFEEVKLEIDYTFITSVLLRFTGKLSSKYIKEIRKAVERMTTISNTYPTTTNVLYTYDAQYGYYSQIGEYQKAIEHSIQFIKLLETKYPDEKLHKFTAKKNLALVHIQLGKYENAGLYLEECIPMLSPGSKYWTYITSLYFITLIRCNQLPTAIELTLKVMQTKKMISLNLFEDAWKIRIAFIHLMIESDFVKLTTNQRGQLKNFSISKFVNDVPLYSKDKLGQNINILFLHIGFLLVTRKYTKIIDRNDALQQYSYRYIKKSKYARAHCFVNLILTVIKANFHPVRTRNLCAPLVKKLDSLVLVIDENEPQYEIIPYNLLWEVFLHIIDHNASIQSR